MKVTDALHRAVVALHQQQSRAEASALDNSLHKVCHELLKESAQKDREALNIISLIVDRESRILNSLYP